MLRLVFLLLFSGESKDDVSRQSVKELPHDFFAECPQCHDKPGKEQMECDFCDGKGYWTVKHAQGLIKLVYLGKQSQENSVPKWKPQ